jgi:hypothetical protein
MPILDSAVTSTNNAIQSTSQRYDGLGVQKHAKSDKKKMRIEAQLTLPVP